MYPTYINRAARKDCDQVYDLVNQAFKIEIGNSGVAYRSCDKYALKDQARKHLEDMLVLRDHRKILGCVHAVVHNGVLEIGPIAVHPEYQGLGYGARLMDAAEAKGRVSVCTVGVPSCRTDIIPFFVKRGYKEAVVKSVEDMRKLYPDELAEKYITRTDIEWIMFMKKKDDEDEDGNAPRNMPAIFKDV